MEERQEVDIRELNTRIERESSFVDMLSLELSRVIVGQRHLVESLLIGLLADGHILLEGVPGLAKTLAISTLSRSIDGRFARVQFTPDLLPADLIGTMIYSQKREEFEVKKGPIFANFVLADEINRAPAKVQSALLEAMQERQVTIGENTYKLPEVKAVVKPEDVIRARDLVREVYLDEKIEQYIVDIVFATRRPGEYGLANYAPMIGFGGSPRASISLALAAKAYAFIKRRGYVIPEDVRAVAMDVLRHRIGLTYEAEAENITTEQIVTEILNRVEVP